MSNSWFNVIPLAKLLAACPTVVRRAGKQIALFSHGERVLACNNRCPHEGFPLSKGLSIMNVYLPVTGTTGNSI